MKEGQAEKVGGPVTPSSFLRLGPLESPCQALSALVLLQMSALPEEASRAPTSRPGPASTHGLDSNRGDGPERGCSRKSEPKPRGLYGVGDPTATFSSGSSLLSSRGSVVKWFWDSAEEGYRTYHMDEYDEDKNPDVSEALLPTGPQGGTAVVGHPTSNDRAAASLLLSCWT